MKGGEQKIELGISKWRSLPSPIDLSGALTLKVYKALRFH